MDLVMQGLMDGQEEWKAKGAKDGGLAGTSNVRPTFAENAFLF